MESSGRNKWKEVRLFCFTNLYCYVSVRPRQTFRMILATEREEEERLPGATIV